MPKFVIIFLVLSTLKGDNGIKAAKIIALMTVIATLTTSLVFEEDKIQGDELIGFSTESTSYTTPDDVSKITRIASDSNFWSPNLKTFSICTTVLALNTERVFRSSKPM